MAKPQLSFWQIWNMSFGFLGIQFGWALQLNNMSAIYEYLGAEPEQIPILWLAAPMTGLLVQPIVGNLSDHTWNRLGRRRPYFTVGAILASIALILMPQSSSLWMAAGLLWILDASINISMEPFRAFVADMLPEEQRTRGFAMQSLFIGLGAGIASFLPYLLRGLGVEYPTGSTGAIPLTIKLSFMGGGLVFLGAVLWTVLKTKEYPPEDMEEFRRRKAAAKGVMTQFREIVGSVRAMPRTMRELAPVQFFTWLGLFCMWLYFSPVVARHIFKAPDTASPLYAEGLEWANLCLGTYSVVCFFFSFALARLAARLGNRNTHSLCLLIGSAGLLSVMFIENPWLLFLSMTGVGIAWASILAIPYAVLSGSLPAAKVGVYMGIFNFFIVIPEIVASFFLGKTLTMAESALGYFEVWPGVDVRLLAVIGGGFSLAFAALLMQRVREHDPLIDGPVDAKVTAA